MTLQDWFDYLRKNNGYADEEELDNAMENPVIKFYYNSLYSAIRKMAIESYIYIARYESKLEYLLERSEIPNSLREYQKQTECDVEELVDICEEAIGDVTSIGRLQLSSNFYLDLDEFTYSANEQELLLAIKHSRLTDFFIYDEGFDNYDEYIEYVIHIIDSMYNEYDCPIADKVLDTYKKIMKNYYLCKIEKHIKSIQKQGVEKYFTKLKFLSLEKELLFFCDIADNIIEYLSKINNEIIIYLNEKDFRNDWKLPISLELFKQEFCYFKENDEQNSVISAYGIDYIFIDDEPVEYTFTTKIMREIVEWAIRIAGIQDFIEITEDEEKITYKNKLLD